MIYSDDPSTARENAEAELDRICGMQTLRHYAAQKRPSMNTVYTHLRHIKAKTGSRWMSELVGKLSPHRVPLSAIKEPR